MAVVWKTKQAMRHLVGKGNLTHASSGLIPVGTIPSQEFSLQFDGIDDYVQAPFPSQIAGLHAFTVELWLYLPELGNHLGSILNIGTTTLRQRHFWQWQTTGIYAKRIIRWYQGIGGCLAPVLDLQRRYHLVEVFNTSTSKHYVDTVLRQTCTYDFSSLSLTAGSVELAKQQPENDWFKGIIRGLRIYDRALELSEIQHNYLSPTPVSDGLVLWFPMDEGEGTILYDGSGQNNNGTIYGATWVEA